MRRPGLQPMKIRIKEGAKMSRRGGRCAYLLGGAYLLGERRFFLGGWEGDGGICGVGEAGMEGGSEAFRLGVRRLVMVVFVVVVSEVLEGEVWVELVKV